MAARIAWDGDVHRTPLGKELPQRGRTCVAEDSIGTAGERRGHPSPLLAEAAVPEGVHTAVNAVQALPGHGGLRLLDAGLLELREPDHAGLFAGPGKTASGSRYR